MKYKIEHNNQFVHVEFENQTKNTQFCYIKWWLPNGKAFFKY